jgi:hypothetical protein
MEGEVVDPTVEELRREPDEGKFEMASNEDLATGEHDNHEPATSQGGNWLDNSPAGAQSTSDPITSHRPAQTARDTALKIYNREDGYEPARVAPYFAGSVAIVLLCIFLAGRSEFPHTEFSQCSAR